jgi:uncharacterized DUF497 family protein
VRFVTIIWDSEDDPEGNIQHVAEHGLEPSEVEFVVENADSDSTSRTSGRPCLFGYTPDGVYIIVIYEQVDQDMIYPVTAYEVQEP